MRNFLDFDDYLRLNSLSISVLSRESVEWSFRLRDDVLTLVNLCHHLGFEKTTEEGLVVIVEFNETRCGILVDSVEMIHRIRWENIDPPPELLTAMGTPLTGVTKLDDRVVQILDFETLLGKLLGTGGVDVEPTVLSDVPPDRKDVRVLVADDSPTIRESVRRILRSAGYENITVCNDGEEAWNEVLKRRSKDALPFDIVLSDIEMPRMDGLHLTARIKEDPHLKAMPVILFSSLISEENVNKGNAVGADAQVVKFKSDTLLRTVEECLEMARRN